MARSEQHIRTGQAIYDGTKHEIALLDACYTRERQRVAAAEVYDGIPAAHRCSGLHISER